MSKNYKTGFAVMIVGYDFVKEDGRVCIFSMLDAQRKMRELKSKGYAVQAIPYCRG